MIHGQHKIIHACFSTVSHGEYLTIMSNIAHAASIIVITRYKIVLRRAHHTTCAERRG